MEDSKCWSQMLATKRGFSQFSVEAFRWLNEPPPLSGGQPAFLMSANGSVNIFKISKQSKRKQESFPEMPVSRINFWLNIQVPSHSYIGTSMYHPGIQTYLSLRSGVPEYTKQHPPGQKLKLSERTGSSLPDLKVPQLKKRMYQNNRVLERGLERWLSS